MAPQFGNAIQQLPVSRQTSSRSTCLRFAAPPHSRRTRRNAPYRASRAAISATCFPWKRAMASSFSEGSRDPSAPVIVEAP